MPTQPFPNSLLRWGAAYTAGLAVFLFVVITATLVTFILPETYASTARILLRPESQAATDETAATSTLAIQIELIYSELVLAPAASELGLAEEWGKRYASGERLGSAEVLALLRGRLEVRHLGNTSLAEITVHSESPGEAARIANEIAGTFCSTFGTNGARIVDRATPGLRPVRPNKVVNITVGVVIGCLLGGLVAAGVLFLTRGKRA